ncbi:MAG: DNA polymerase IV, partial [Gammaproteobacteria bacterium]|nr:DNA polymerase IV [Gammaproteobacteria bacterium]
ISYNKFLAKIASDMDKPDGLYLITPEQGEKFVEQLKVRKFHGVGKATEAKMKALGISTGADLRQWKENALIKEFGKAGRYYFQIARGIDHRPVRNNRIRKSIGSETTFQEDISDIDVMLSKLKGLSEKVFMKLLEKELSARTVTLKVKYNNFELVTRSITRENIVKNAEDMMSVLGELIYKTEAGARKVRLIGVSLSKLEAICETSTEQSVDDEQLNLL